MSRLVRRSFRHRLSTIIVRLLFLMILPLLVVQLLVARWWREPFPAIMMPRFTHQTVEQGVTTWKDVRITLEHDDGTRSILDKHQLLEAMHLPQRNKVLRRVFGPDAPAACEESVLVWLSQRVTAIRGRDDARRVQFTWFEVEARFAEPGQARWERIVGRLSLDLKPRVASPLPRNDAHFAGGSADGNSASSYE